MNQTIDQMTESDIFLFCQPIVAGKVGEYGEITLNLSNNFNVTRESVGSYLITIHVYTTNTRAFVTTNTKGGEPYGFALLGEPIDATTFRVLGKHFVTSEPLDVAFNFMVVDLDLVSSKAN